jgi:hypothetical protein
MGVPITIALAAGKTKADVADDSPSQCLLDWLQSIFDNDAGRGVGIEQDA